MTSDKELIALQLPSDPDDFSGNLQRLLEHLERQNEGSIIVAPELVLSNFSFDRLNRAADFTEEAMPKLLKATRKKTLCFTAITRAEGGFYNEALLLHDGRIFHRQPKVKLFRFGDEHRYYLPGDEEKIKIVEIEGLRFAILICFEIRFCQFWERIKGADIIMIPALWGELRKSQFEAITRALAIMNQAFVIAANSANDDMAKSSGIITPFGEERRDDTAERIGLEADLREIRKMRRYMDIGLR
ncbi:MAG: hypothetical protein B6D59_04700 [Campylobacteraceae bacterium 4484_4]|nr:MAG: hypothetical protein B6D59_04700 [Campylobacteraceae bacterium 4484_4]